jgi:hypothetical protein
VYLLKAFALQIKRNAELRGKQRIKIQRGGRGERRQEDSWVWLCDLQSQVIIEILMKRDHY